MLTTLFKLVWRAELVPCAWRHGVITSLFKAGDRAECNNYRPITLLPTIGKLFTAIMATRLERFVPLHDHQSAFRKARGTMDPLFVFSATILERKARGLRTHAFFLDLKKAYDMVWHDGLFYKLHKKGVKAKTWRLIWDMYSKGENSASLDGHVSAPFRLLQGVAQGDPMSCVLFNVMIDDLIDTLERTHGADGVTLVPGAKNLVAQGYADDISSPSGTRVGLQRIINTYSSHLARWKGVVNIDKSCTLTFNPGGAAVDSTGAHIADDGEGAWNWNGTPMPHVHKIKYLGLVFTSDCTWDAHVARARECGFGALAMWRGVLRNNLLTLGTKLTVISACIKTPITYGMEVWAPRTTACAKALEVPLRRALRAALGVPSGEARALYPVDLMHYDTAVRTIASETRAAHVRYWQSVRSLPEARLQRVTLDMLPGTHPWLRRALQWRDELVEADPEAPIADILTDDPPPPPPPGDASRPGRAPKYNHEINVAVAKSDTTRYLEASRLAGRPVLTLAMRDAPCVTRQPYCRGRNILPLMLFRAGRFQRDPVPPRGDQPPDCCPDCHCVVTPEDSDCPSSDRAYRIVLHRVTSCLSNAAVTAWYHDVAVRILPDPELMRAIVGARAAEGLWARGDDVAWELSCRPFLRHLLSPTTVCPEDATVTHAKMLRATRLFLTTLDVDVAALPDPASFGEVPELRSLPPAGPGAAGSAVLGADFWELVERRLPPVPRARPGHEAEAPWVRRRRRVQPRRGHGAITD
jgi:hypothetical protein